jgi:hypothetical protein
VLLLLLLAVIVFASLLSGFRCALGIVREIS